MEQNIYRLIGGDFSQSRGVQLPIKGKFIEKIVEENNKKVSKGFKRIVYIKGSDSIFLEDQKGDLKPQQAWFRFGDLRVDKNDHVLNEILQKHEWFNKKYVLWSEAQQTKEELAELRFKGEARKLIDDSDPDKIKAIALAVFGYGAIAWDDEKSELELRKYADEKPKKLKEVMDEKDYEAKLLAGHAFVQDIVKENDVKTAVVWSETDGVILKLAKGEKGITELGRYLATRTDESEMVLQSIGERLEKIATNTKPKGSDELLSEKDREIAELKAKLAQQTGEKDDDVDDDIKEAHAKYEAKFEKQVPVNMKNNLEWINSKLEES